MEVPVLEAERVCGTLRAERKGLYTIFYARVDTEAVCRLWAVFEGGETALGVPAPEQGRMTLRISVPTSRLPAGNLRHGELRPREESRWQRFPGGTLGETRLPAGWEKHGVYRFPWCPGDRLPNEALLCFFRYVREGELSFLEIELDRQGRPVV